MSGSMAIITGSINSPRQGKVMKQVKGPTWGPTQETRPDTGLEIVLQYGSNIHTSERTRDKLPKILDQHPSKKQGQRQDWRQVHPLHSSGQDQRPKPKLKWSSWDHGQKAWLEAPGEAGQGH